MTGMLRRAPKSSISVEAGRVPTSLVSKVRLSMYRRFSRRCEPVSEPVFRNFAAPARRRTAIPASTSSSYRNGQRGTCRIEG